MHLSLPVLVVNGVVCALSTTAVGSGPITVNSVEVVCCSLGGSVVLGVVKVDCDSATTSCESKRSGESGLVCIPQKAATSYSAWKNPNWLLVIVTTWQS